MREIRPYGSEGGGAPRSPYPYPFRIIKGKALCELGTNSIEKESACQFSF
jgi:hypothetical protein